MAWRKRFGGSLLAAVLLASPVGCSLVDENPIEESADIKQGSNTITVWAWDDQFNIIAVEEAAKLYKEIRPDIKVNVATIAQNDVIQKVHTGLSAGSYNTLPDIFLMEDSKIRNFLITYPGEIKLLNDRIDMSRFMEYKLDGMTLGTAIYGVPFDSGVAATFYRTDYLREAGYTEKDLQNITWEQYIEIGKNVLDKTGKVMITLEPGDPLQLRIMLQSAGTWYVQADGETIHLEDNVALRQAIKIYQKMLDSGIARPVADWNSYLYGINSGEVATTVSGCWVASSVTKQVDQRGKWAIAPVPRMGENENSINASNVGGSSWYVLSRRENADLAVDFLAETFATSNELMNTLVEEINLVSTLISASDTPNYHRKSEFFSDQPIFEKLALWAYQIPSVSYGRATVEIERLVAEALQKIMGGTATVDEALALAQTEAENLWE